MRHSSRFGISQNFLRHPSLVDRLIQKARLAPGELVLDLGAGSGAITERLVRHGCRVIAVEADPCLGYPLRDRFAGCDAVEVRVAEIAQCRLPRAPYKVFANIPFTITAELIQLLTSAGQPPDDAYLVVQREAAQRFLGRPRPTLVAALLAPWFELSVEYRFRRWDFTPPPGVEPVLLRLRKRGPPLIRDDRRQCFRDFVVALFGAPRPIRDSVRHLLGADAALRLGCQLELGPLVRPAQLDVERWPALFTAFDVAASRQTRRCLAGAEARLSRERRRLDKLHRTRFARQVHPGETSEGRSPPARRMWRDGRATRASVYASAVPPLRTTVSRRTGGVLLVALSAACFAAMPIFARTVYAAGSDPSTLLLLRFTAAAAVLLPLALRRSAARPPDRPLSGLVLLGALYVCQSLLYFVALTMTPVTLVALLLYVYPVVVAVLASVLFHIPLTRWRVVALTLALTGAALTVIGPLGGGNWLGISLALAAALMYSGYILLATRITRSVDSLWSSAIITATAGALFAVLAVFRGVALPTSGTGWAAVVGIALVSTVFAILAFMAGLIRVGPTDAATLSVLEPVITALLAVLLLGETLGPAQLVGGALIVVAVLIVARVDVPRLEPIEDYAIAGAASELPLATGSSGTSSPRPANPTSRSRPVR